METRSKSLIAKGEISPRSCPAHPNKASSLSLTMGESGARMLRAQSPWPARAAASWAHPMRVAAPPATRLPRGAQPSPSCRAAWYKSMAMNASREDDALADGPMSAAARGMYSWEWE